MGRKEVCELWNPGRHYIEMQYGKIVSWVDVKSRKRASIHGREEGVSQWESMCAFHGINHVGKFKPLVCMIAMKGNFASRQHSFFSLPHLRTFTWSEELKAESNHQLLGQRLREFLSLSRTSASPLLLAAAEVPFLLKLFHLLPQESSGCFMVTRHYTSVPSTIALDE